MRKILFLILALALLASPKAFALMCEQSQAYGGSDACWTEVRLSPNETEPSVSAGTVLVYDYANGDVTKSPTWVRVSTASLDGNRVAGVTQTSISAGNVVKVLVRGYGLLNISNGMAVSSGDALYVRGAGGGRGAVTGDANPATVNGRPIAFALETVTAGNNPQKKAFIRVI